MRIKVALLCLVFFTFSAQNALSTCTPYAGNNYRCLSSDTITSVPSRSTRENVDTPFRKYIKDDSGNWIIMPYGDFVGPAAATDNAVVRFDGTTGKIGQDSAVLIADTTGDVTAGTYNTVAISGTSTPTIAVTGTSSIAGDNTGDNAVNTTYANDYRAGNFVAGTDYLTPTGSAAFLTSFPTLNQNTTGSAGSTVAAVTFTTTGGAVSGASFDGSTAQTIDYSTVGAAPTSHNQDATTITTGALDGDRLPALSTTKRAGVPATGTPSGKFLKDDDTWAAPSGGSVNPFITLTSSYTLTSQTALQKIFNAPTNGAYTAAANTTYFFELDFSLTSISSTSGYINFGVLGTATISSIYYTAVSRRPATTTPSAANVVKQTTVSDAFISAASTGTTGDFLLKGKIVVGAGGTIIPAVGMTQAAAAVVGTNATCKIWAVGSDSVQSSGDWN